MNDYLHAPLNWALSNGWRPSQDTNFGDFSFMRVTADRTLWEWWTNAPPDVLGIVLYNPKEEYGKQLAEETARLMKAGRGINDIRTHIQTGATAANILVQMANDPLDVIVSFQDAYHKKTPRSFLCAALSIVPFVPGSIIRKGDDLGVLGKAEVMATNEATAAVTRSIGAKTWQEYESGIRRLYGASSVGSRKFKTVVDGKVVNGVADNITTIGGRSVAVEAKFVNDWAKSIRNPASPIGNMPFAVAEQANMLEQARKYSAAFDEVICHSNSPELIAHYSTVFQGAGILNFRFILTQ
jgi:hypothetical protein